MVGRQLSGDMVPDLCSPIVHDVLLVGGQDPSTDSAEVVFATRREHRDRLSGVGRHRKRRTNLALNRTGRVRL